MKNMPGFEAMQAQQRAFLEAMMQGWGPVGASAPSEEKANDGDGDKSDSELAAIKKQLSELQAKLKDI
jgi:hypothetical protein